MALVGVIIGVPMGLVVVGRAVWNTFANTLGAMVCFSLRRLPLWPFLAVDVITHD